MRIISALLLSGFTVLLHAQSPVISEVLVTGNCYGNAQPNQLTKGLTGAVKGLNVQRSDTDTAKRRIVIRCGYSKPVGPGPLLVVDGFPQKLSLLGSINPNNIISVEIMKSAAAQAIYGRDAMEGVIIVTTNKDRRTVFVIKDSLDGSRIAGATVSFISADKKDTMMYVADEKGIVKPDADHTMQNGNVTISAVGYKSCQQPIDKNSILGQEITLSPDIKPLGEIILRRTFCHIIRCYRSTCRRVIDCEKPFIKGGDSTVIHEETRRINIFPNPLIRGSSFNISLKENQKGLALLRVFVLNGNLVLQQNIVKASVLQTVRTDPRWAAGVYFVQLVYENGRVAASDRIIIQ